MRQIFLAYATVGIVIYIKTILFLKDRIHDAYKVEERRKETEVSIEMLNKYDVLSNMAGASHQNVRSLQMAKVTWSEPKWMQKVKDYHEPPGKYFLIEVLQVRIYEQDKAKWTIKELKQWIHYMLWAGVQHIFLCDHYKYEHESLANQLEKYIESNLITYLPFPHPRIARQAQILCYNSIIARYKYDVEWQMSIDMDEYPFISYDIEEGFLARYLKTMRENVVEVSMPNFLMLGQGDRSRDMVIERINRITSLSERTNDLSKPIYKPMNTTVDIHETNYRLGKRYVELGDRLKNLHYWGARLQDWGPDTQEVLERTVEFNEVRNKLAPIIRKSLLAFGENDAFSNTTGP